MAAAIGVLSLTLPARGIADDQRDALGVMAEGYLANRESFTSFTCRFRVTVARAASIADATSGRFTTTEVTWEGLWLVNSTDVRYELICDPAIYSKGLADAKRANPQKMADGRSVVPLACANTYYLRSKSIVARQSKEIMSVNLYPEDVPDRVGMTETPFDLGVMGGNEASSPGRLLRMCLDGKYDGRFRGNQRVDGVDVLAANIAEKGQPPRHTFLLDPNRGFLPLALSDTNLQTSNRYYEASILEARKCRGDRWFPMRGVVVMLPDGPPPYQVREVKVWELEIDKPPARDQFYLDVPSGTQVSVPTKPYWVNLAADERVRLDDLDKLYSRCVANGKKQTDQERRLLGPVDEKGSQRRAPLRWTLAAITIVVGVVSAAFLVWRRKRRRMAR